MAPLDPPTSAPGAPDATPATRHVVVIGGGLAGLVAARQVLRERPGTRVTILEATDRIGGKLRLERVAGHLVDVGAEAMLARRPEAVDLVRELGAEDELVSPATTAASIWSRGRMHPVPRATLMGVPADATGLGGLLTDEERARLEDEQPWPEGPLTTDVSVGGYVGTRLGRAVVDRLVEPLLGGVYAGRADELSLAATMPAVWEAATRGDSLRAVAAAAAAARWGGGAPSSAGASPATTADPRSGPPSERPVFAGIRGGIGRLPSFCATTSATASTSARRRSLVACAAAATDLPSSSVRPPMRSGSTPTRSSSRPHLRRRVGSCPHLRPALPTPWPRSRRPRVR